MPFTGGRSSFGKNIIDTDQIFDAAVTAGKIDPTLAVANTAAILAAAKNSTRMGVITAAVDCTASATVPIGTVPAGSMVTDVITVTTTAINGSGTFNVGDTNNTLGYLANANVTKTLNAVSGEDPVTRGAYLYVPGAPTTTAGDWTVTVWSATAGTQTLTPSNWAVTTFGHPRRKFYAADTIVNATVTVGSNTAGLVTVYVFYMRGVMA